MREEKKWEIGKIYIKKEWIGDEKKKRIKKWIRKNSKECHQTEKNVKMEKKYEKRKK